MVEQYKEDYEAFLAAAQKASALAAIEASEVVLSYWPSPTNASLDPEKTLDIVSKADGIGNFATLADFASGDAIRKVFSQYPFLDSIPTISEEAAPDQSEHRGPWWNIDEVDGTANFSRGSDHFGINIALHGADNNPAIGVIAFPARRELIFARPDLGTSLLRFSQKGALGDLVMVADLTANAAKLPPDLPNSELFVAYDLGYSLKVQQLQDGAVRLADRVSALKSYHSSSYTLGELALGKLDAFFTRHPTIYDIGASTVAIEAIGGRVSDMHGDPVDWTGAPRQGFLAGRTPHIHERLLEMLHSA